MAVQGYGSVPPRIGIARPGSGIIGKELERGPQMKTIQKPPPMKTAKMRLARPGGRIK